MLSVLKQFSTRLLSPDLHVRRRYVIFQELLNSDRKCHKLLAELEEIYYGVLPVDINRVRALYEALSSAVASMIEAMYKLAPGKHKNLVDYYKKNDIYVRFALAPPKTDSAPPYILPIDAVYSDDSHTGGKGLHLSQLVRNLHLPVPPGFIISTSAWNRILEVNDLRLAINRELAKVDIHSPSSLKDVSQTLSGYIEDAGIPDDLEQILAEAASELQAGSCRLAVRSSAVGEDSSLSFAGLYRSQLDVDPKHILKAYRRVLASKYTPEAIFYRVIHGLNDEETPMAVIVLTMVDARLSGVVTTGDPSGRVRVCSVPGLGDNLMGGYATPVTAEIDTSGEKPVTVSKSSVGEDRQLDDDQLHHLSGLAGMIADYYGESQEIEWSCDRSGALFFLQARSRARYPEFSATGEPDLSGLTLLFQGGKTASSGIGSGSICRLSNVNDISSYEGAIFVCEVTPPEMVPLLPHFSGVIVRNGSGADHFSSVAREFGVPVLVQAGEATKQLKNGDKVTLWADKQSVFQGMSSIPSGKNAGKTEGLNENPLQRTLKMMVGFTSKLSLTDAGDKSFSPENCRSLHDIIRFSHEKSLQAMFLQSADTLLRKPKGPRLQTSIPLQVHIIDVGGGLWEEASQKQEITLDDLRCRPFLSLWQGLSHPEIDWQGCTHYDWRTYDAVALAGGVCAGDDASLASYCLISSDYLNASFRFGYHFSLLDCLCGDNPQENYILLRFAGGGGNALGKDLRLSFIAKVLGRLNFSHERTGDLLDARLLRYGNKDTAERMVQVGRLLGVVRLLDMVMADEGAIEPMVEKFFTGQHDFFGK